MPDDVRTLQQLIAGYFDDDDWPTNWGDGGVVEAAYEGTNGVWRCVGRVREPEAQFVFYSIAPLTVDDEHTASVAEYLTRANDGMVIGNFELTWDRGEVRCKTAIDVEGGDLTPSMWRNLVYLNVHAMDRYLAGLTHVANGTMAAEEAVREAEA